MEALTIRQNGFEVKYEPVCRLYARDETGMLYDLREEYSLPELGGVIPRSGDRIVDPGVLAGLDRSEPSNRTVYEVVRRYFKPAYPKFPLEKSESMTAWFILEVVARPGDDQEADLLLSGYG